MRLCCICSCRQVHFVEIVIDLFEGGRGRGHLNQKTGTTKNKKHPKTKTATSKKHMCRKSSKYLHGCNSSRLPEILCFGFWAVFGVGFFGWFRIIVFDCCWYCCFFVFVVLFLFPMPSPLPPSKKSSMSSKRITVELALILRLLSV